MLPITFQEYIPDDKKFDIILLMNSINHLDEEACANLLWDEISRNKYIDLFHKLYDLATSGAYIIITDASRYNFFASLGMKNPFASSITWQLHQSPYYWAKLLQEAGFNSPQIRWKSYNRLGHIGRMFLANRVASYFLGTTFCLTMKK